MSEQSINAEGYKEFLDACAFVRSFGYEIAVIGQTDALRARIVELEKENALMYDLMTSGEQRGIEKAAAEYRARIAELEAELDAARRRIADLEAPDAR